MPEQNNFIQTGDTIECGHCHPEKYTIPAPCECKCHLPEQTKEGWERELTKLWQDVIWCPPNYLFLENIKSFIRQELATARREAAEEENQAWMDGKRCISCGKDIAAYPTTNSCIDCWQEE